MRPQLVFYKIIIILALTLFGLVAVGCGEAATPTGAGEQPETPGTTVPPEPDLEGDPVRGGKLYDKWWVVIAEDEEHEHEEEEGHEGKGPSTDQPLWATQDTNTRSGEETWRCKECHGWDYKGADGAYGSGSHSTGFPGIFGVKDKPASEVLEILKGSTNSDHDFSTVMDEQALVDLALFITQALVEDNEVLNDDNTSAGDAIQGGTLYGNVCTYCHGPAGNAINFNGFDEPEFIGHIAADNPWEFIHKVRFGQPGWPMPSGITNGWSLADVANVLAYAETFTTDPYFGGGGLLYDSWWSALDLDAPAEDNPLWATQDTNTRSGADTWRCKECHGWDYLGAEGAYGSGSHFTGFPGVLGTASMSADGLIAWLTGGENPDHDFSGVMDEAALQAMAKFIREEMADITAYVNADGTVNGDPAKGKEMFEGTCAACHGVDGKRINFHDPDDPEYIGTVAVDNPWEFFHKASFGQPGAPMPAGRALGWALEQIADLLAYAQTLPTK